VSYKDKDKQREANRKAKARQRVKISAREGQTQSQGMTTEQIQGMTPADNVIPDSHTQPERTAKGNIRVSKPGDADYKVKPKGSLQWLSHLPKATCNLPKDKPIADVSNDKVIKYKRGKDIKCFEDLPPDVRRTIEKMSTIEDGKMDLSIKANRTAIAINYQHLFPGRYNSTGAR